MINTTAIIELTVRMQAFSYGLTHEQKEEFVKILELIPKLNKPNEPKN